MIDEYSFVQELGEEIRKLSSTLSLKDDELSLQKKENQALQAMVLSGKKETAEEYRMKMEEQKHVGSFTESVSWCNRL